MCERERVCVRQSDGTLLPGPVVSTFGSECVCVSESESESVKECNRERERER